MTPRSLITGIVLITAAVMLPVAGWRLSVKAYNDDHFETPVEKLVDAAGDGKLDTIQALIRSGVPVNRGSEGGMAPLFAAVCSGKAAAVKLLLSRGADVNARYKLTAGEEQRIARARYKGVWNVSDGDTPLLACAQTGNLNIAKLLISEGADVRAENDAHSNAVSIAMAPAGGSVSGSSSVEMVRLLIEKGASAAVTDSSGDTPLMWAIQRNDKPLALALIKAGADINSINVFRETALILAARANTLPDIALLIAQKAKDVNATDSKGNSPLWYAVYNDRQDLVKALLARGADTNPVNSDGSTPLITATFLEKTQMVRLLVGARADTRIKDKSGMTASDWAKAKQDNAIISILRNAPKPGE